VKWLVDEIDRDQALRLYENVPLLGGTFVAPAHVLGEASSAIYKRVRQGGIVLEDALRLVDDLQALPILAMSPPGLHRRAFEIAARFQLKWIYDAFYVALAEIIGCELWTADEALHQAVREAHTNVRLLAEYPLD
jgi:predicted nucleic acid-binding protein